MKDDEIPIQAVHWGAIKVGAWGREFFLKVAKRGDKSLITQVDTHQHKAWCEHACALPFQY